VVRRLPELRHYCDAFFFADREIVPELSEGVPLMEPERLQAEVQPQKSIEKRKETLTNSRPHSTRNGSKLPMIPSTKSAIPVERFQNRLHQ